MSDIVERLRGHFEDKDTDAWMSCAEAADEITRLRAENERLRKDIIWLINEAAEQNSAALHWRPRMSDITMLYRKPTSSPIHEVRVLFDAARERNIGMEYLVDATGYSRDVLSHIRRPTADGQGTNPSYLVLQALAQVLGYEFRLVPIQSE